MSTLDKGILNEFKNKPLTYTVQVVGVIVILLNVWLSTKLFPLAKDIDAIVQKAKALESDIIELQVASEKHEEIIIDVKEMAIKVSDIQQRLERIDNRLSKHLGI